MKKSLFLIGVLFLLGSCSNKTPESQSDSMNIADTAAVANTDSIAGFADTAMPEEPTTKEETQKEVATDDGKFEKSLPDMKKLINKAEDKAAGYLKSLGFKGSMKDKGVEEDWQSNGTFTLQSGDKKCTIKIHQTGYEAQMTVTVTGDDAALTKLYNEAKAVKSYSGGTPVKTTKSGNSIHIDIQLY